MRGKVLIVVMLALALGLAAFAWAWNYQRSARARAFWGERATTIRFAKKVEAFRPDQSTQDTVDISGAPGLLNARTALMSDDGFDWSVEPFSPEPSAEWEFGVRFHDDARDVTLLFSDENHYMLVGESGRAVALDPKTSAGWLGYLEKALTKPELK